jgi:hypothetical protein
LFFSKKSWKESLVVRILINVGWKMLLFPMAGMLVKKGLMHIGCPGSKIVGEGVFVTGVEMAATAIKPL